MKNRSLPHFLLFGLLSAIGLLVVFGLPSTGEEDRRVVINDSDIAQLRASWMRQWQREPTPQELRGLLENLVREEVLYREALARGFDENDQMVRRAMMRKMEFLGQTQVEASDPTEAEIEAYYALSKERYRRPGAVTFVQLYFSQDRRGAAAETAAEEALAQLAGIAPDAVDPRQYGDPIMLEPSYRNFSKQQVANTFGNDFAAQLFQLDTGKWQGPVVSG